ncbi:hypothetical protein EV127DRAFT_428547 [Xylaria flabelliformis]|nr:hypothetical protein EV127DRAFT_428547 [Xylaria flabelliformis]
MPLFPWRRKARVKSDNLSQPDLKAFPSGIKELYCPSTGSAVDIVFIHGLTGDRERTWTAKNASQPWPKTLLASKLPTARILTFGYNAYVTGWKGIVSQNRIADHSFNLLIALAHYREGKEDTALSTAREQTDPRFKSILRSVRGIIFLGTPHYGAGLAVWGNRLSTYIGVVKWTNSKIVEVLRADSEVLARIQNGFHTMIQARSAEELESIKIICFYEEIPLKVIGFVVPRHSAVIPGYTHIGIHSNHMDMCRFETADAPGFKSIYEELHRWISEIDIARSSRGIPSASGTIGALQNRPMGQNREECRMPQFIVPYPRNPQFVGRSEILEQLESQLSYQQPYTNQPHCRIALYGLGGIGKTQIALAYIYRLEGTASDISIFWVHASNTDRFRQAYAEIAEKCQVPGYDDPKADVLLLVKKWLEEKHQGRWLMVIDNADDAQLFCRPAKLTNTDGQKYLGQYIPECSQGTVLITTRNKQVGLQLIKGMKASLLGINKMNDAECSQLLRASLDDNLTATEEFSTLARRLEQLPLALAQASAFIQENTITVERYIRLLDQGDHNFVSLLSEEFATIGRDSDTPHAVAATWILSFEQIEQQNPLACELLLLISLFDRQAIPMEFLSDFLEVYHNEPPIEDIELTRAIGVLKAYSLINEENNESLTLHRLIHLVTQKWLATKETMRQFAEKAIVTVSRCYPYGEYENREKCAAYLPHVQAVLKLNGVESRDENIARATILHHAASFFYLQGQWNLAETFQTQARDIREKILGPNHLDTLDSINNLALIYQSQGRWREAEILRVQVMETSKATLGPDHPDTLISMGNIASTYQSQGRWREAEILRVQVMETHKATLGLDHPDTLISMGNIASTYQSQGRLKEAEILRVQVMETSKATLGPDHPDTLLSMSNLASTYQSQGRWKEAETLEVQVMETRKATLGPDHPDTLTSMHNLAHTWKSQGRVDDAIQLMEHCVEARRRVIGEDHPDAVVSLSVLTEWRTEQVASDSRSRSS